jgi:hypothetical protein
MPISVTITRGQVVVCIFVGVRSPAPAIAGPFENSGAAFTHLQSSGIKDEDSYEEAGRLAELGVPFFIASVPEQPGANPPQF